MTGVRRGMAIAAIALFVGVPVGLGVSGIASGDPGGHSTCEPKPGEKVCPKSGDAELHSTPDPGHKVATPTQPTRPGNL